MILHALTYLLFCIPLAIELLFDHKRIVKERKVDNHFEDTLVRGVMIIAFAVVDCLINEVFIWQSLILGVAFYWLVFDYSINYLIGNHWTYLGNTSWLDRKLNKLNGFMLLLIKLFVMMCAVMVYYHLDKFSTY